MPPDIITWLWLIAGVLLIATELFLPRLVVCFLGAGAILVAVLRWIGLIAGATQSTVAWIVSSLVMLVGLRHFLLRYFPSEVSVHMTDEDLEAVGQIVDVVHAISSENKDGRIWFCGTSWPAVTREGAIPAGRKARLVFRDNLMWIVEPCTEIQNSSKETE